MSKPTSIDKYIAGFPEAIQILLQQIRTTIHKAAPEVVETIKYDMPTFMLRGKSFLIYRYEKGLLKNIRFSAQLIPSCPII